MMIQILILKIMILSVADISCVMISTNHDLLIKELKNKGRDYFPCNLNAYDALPNIA